MRILTALALLAAASARRMVGYLEDCAGVHEAIPAATGCFLALDEAEAARYRFALLEEDGRIGIDQWNLDRIDQPDLPLDNAPFTPLHTGRGVRIYVIDTGLYAGHSQFGGRARSVSVIPGPVTGDDHGHGTHCAATAAGRSYGVARDAELVGVKVLDRSGSGSFSDVIRGVTWAVQDCGGAACVLSMSLGGGVSKVVDRAVRQAAARGMVVAVAAGNSRSDACRTSPASSGGNGRRTGVLTVGSTDPEDNLSYFSNHGRCVDLLAPGRNVLSAWIGAPGASRVLSGTSMATPAVAGVLAALLQKHALDKKRALDDLFAMATRGRIANVPRDTPNLLLTYAERGDACGRRTRRRGCRRDPECSWSNGQCIRH